MLKSWRILSFLRDNHLKENTFVQAVRSGWYLESAGSVSGLEKSEHRGHIFFFFPFLVTKAIRFFHPPKCLLVAFYTKDSLLLAVELLWLCK